MAFLTPDRVLEGSLSAGSGDFTLTGNIIGFRQFSAVASIGDLLPYYIEAIDLAGSPSGEYEVGLGRYKAANVLERLTVKASSNAGSLVVFSAGQKVVGVGVPGWDVQTKSGRVGEVVFVAASSAKDGTLACDGQAVSRTDYANLYAFAAASGLMAVDAADKTANPAKYGPGDGVTTFQLPDLRDRGVIGRGTSFAIGTTGGSKDAVVVAHTHTGTTASAGDHTHTASDGNAFSKAGGSFSYGGGGTSLGTSATTSSAGAHTHTITTDSTGVSGTNANMQPYAALLACIYY